MPMVFRKHFPRCIVIIDCFEVFLDPPTDLLVRARSFGSFLTLGQGRRGKSTGTPVKALFFYHPKSAENRLYDVQ